MIDLRITRYLESPRRTRACQLAFCSSSNQGEIGVTQIEGYVRADLPVKLRWGGFIGHG